MSVRKQLLRINGLMKRIWKLGTEIGLDPTFYPFALNRTSAFYLEHKTISLAS